MTKKFSLLSLILAFMLLVSLSPAGAAETNQVTSSQQSVTYYYDAKGTKINASSLSGDAVVEMKKFVEQRLDASGNPIENEFLVTLQVRTTERIEELSSDTPDAAVTLVVDVSNSMDDCYHCGQEASHINHGGLFYKCPGNRNTYFEGSNTNSNTRCDNCDQRFRYHTATNMTADHAYESRLSFAQKAALDFIDQFANETGAEEGDKRYVALITFGSHAAARTQYIDVATESGMLAAELAIKNITVANSGVSFTDSDGDSVTDPGGTNIEGGLMLADNMIAANTASGRALDGIHYLYTILLTDGTPTYYVNGDDASTTAILGTRGGGSSTTKNDVKDVGVEAAKILAHSPQSRLFSICFGTDSTGDDVWDSQPFSTWNDANPATSSRDTVGDWLKKFSSAAYDASNLDGGLFDSFESVITQIQLAAQAWHVADQMGPHINYLGNALVSTGSGVIGNDVSFTGDTLTWNILGSQPDPRISTVTTQNGVTTGILGYTCQYYISLDNLDPDYTNKTDSTDTNDHALLTYATKNDDGEWNVIKDAPFPKPEVKGLVGSFTFKKINEEGEALPGIQFTLRDMVDGADYTRTATSDANGMVTFTGIPSGHSYRLDEQTAASDKFLDLGDILFDISWGEFIPKSSAIEGDANGYFITNHYGPDSLSGLTLEKVFEGDRPEDAHYVEFTLRGARDHNMNYVQTIRLNNANNWRNTFANLDPGWYTLEEITSFEGYDNTLKIEYTVMDNGQQVTRQLLDENQDGSYDIHLNAMDQYTEYTAKVTNTLKRHAGDVTIQKTFYEHDLNATTDRHMEGLTQLTDDLYSHIQVAVSATPQGASTPYATIYLNKDNDFKATFNDLPAGVYTLSETVTGDVEDHAFVHSLFLRNGQEVTRTLTVHKDDNISLELQNHYRHYLGHIRVEKVVAGDLTNNNELLQNKTFVVQVYSVDDEKLMDTLYLDAQHNWVDSTPLIPVGQYHLVEKSQDASLDGFTWLEDQTTLTGDVVETDDETHSVIVEVTPGEEAYVAKTVILTNVYERKEGTLIIEKAFDETSDLQKEYFENNNLSFDIFVEGPNQYSQALQLNKENNWNITLPELPIGQYTITERANVNGYLHTFEITNNGVVNITDKGEVVITITNKYEEIKGGLIVEKFFKLQNEDGSIVDLPANLKDLLHDAKVEVTATHQEKQTTATQTLDWHNDFKAVFTELSLGTYDLAETGAAQLPGYHLVKHTFDKNPLTITENDAEPPKALLTNVYARDTGSITVEKQFAQGSELDQNTFAAKGLSIRLTLTSEDGVSFKDEFIFQDGVWSKSFHNLPTGKYIITESAQVSGYDLSAVVTVNGKTVTDGVVEITENEEQIAVIITNDYRLQRGALEVKKSFVDEHGNPFDAALVSGLKIQVTATATLDASITGSVILDASNGFTGRIENLPLGVYALKEEILEGSIQDYSLVSSTFTPATANITKGGVAEISLVNVYGRDTGSLAVEKVFVDQNNNPLAKELYDALTIKAVATAKNDSTLSFTFTLNKDNQFKATVNEIPTGEYELKEEVTGVVPGYTLAKSQFTPATVIVSNNAAAAAVVKLTNVYSRDLGDLTITKLFGDASDLKQEDFENQNLSVQFTVTSQDDPTIKYAFTFNKDEGWIEELKNLPTGTYLISESAQVDGYTLVADLPNNGVVQVTKGTKVEFTCTNTYTTIVGSLKVDKVFVDESGAALDKNLYQALFIKVTAKNNNGVTGTAILKAGNGFSGTIADLPVGEYDLTEEITGAIPGYTFVKSEFAPSKVQVTENAAAMATAKLTNTYSRDLGSITVEKQFDQNSALSKEYFETNNLQILVTIRNAEDATQAYEVTLNKDNAWKQTVPNLPTGKYQISESAQIDGYTLTSALTGDQVTNGVVTLEKDAAAHVIITNRYDPFVGSLTIQKLFGDTSDLKQEDFENQNLSVQFTVTNQADPSIKYEFAFNQQNGWTKTLSNLPIGTYQISEAAQVNGYALVADLPNDGVVVVEKDTALTVTCTNTYTANTGSLQVSKQFKNASGSALSISQYKNVVVKVTATSKTNPAIFGTVTLDAVNNYSGIIANLPVGDYELTEEFTGNIPGYTFTKAEFSPSTVTVTNGTAMATATLTNTYTQSTGSITIEKQFDSDSALTKEYFEEAGLRIQVTIRNADNHREAYAIFLGKHNNWKQTISGLPIGRYQIIETAPVDGYTHTSQFIGPVESYGIVTVKKNANVSLTIVNSYKPCVGTLIIKKTLAGDTDKAADEYLFTVSSDDGYHYTVAVKRENDWTGSIALPVGNYTVTEQVADGSDYRVRTIMTPANGKVTIADKQTVTVTCTNEYEAAVTARIPVEKTVVLTGNIAPGHNTFAFQAQVNIPAECAGNVTWSYQNDPANASGALQGDQNADTFFIAVQDVATVKGWIVMNGYPSDLAKVTLTLKEKSEYATAEDAANANWILDDTVFGGAEWNVSFNEDCQPVIRRSDAAEDAAIASFTNTCTAYKDINIPETGDQGMPHLWMALALVSLCSIVILMIRKRKEA